ncbi:hypothetical protein STEG23_034133 [Scotinomys teguina]
MKILLSGMIIHESSKDRLSKGTGIQACADHENMKQVAKLTVLLTLVTCYLVCLNILEIEDQRGLEQLVQQVESAHQVAEHLHCCKRQKGLFVLTSGRAAAMEAICVDNGRSCSAVEDRGGVSRGEQLEQRPSLLSVQEGDSAVIKCTYTDSSTPFFAWYKQEPGSGLQFLINILSNVDRKEEQGLIVLLKKKDKHFSLNITAVHPRDTATYFCAASAQCSSGTRFLYIKLIPGLQKNLKKVLK